MISTSSVLSALIVYSIATGVICVLRRQTEFLKKHGVSVLVAASVVATVRLFLPFEVLFTYAVRSWAILGPAQLFLREHPVIEQGLLMVWAAGAVVVVGWDVFVLCCAHIRSRNYVVGRNEVVQRVAERCNVKYPVYVTPDVDVARVAGIFRYVIYLPDADLPEREIEFILAHEVQHIRNHDAQIKLFVGLLTAAMWWNPFAHWFRRELSRLLELRCDAKVTEHMNKVEQTEYLEMLQHMAERIAAGKRAPALALDESEAVSAVGKALFIYQRFRVILSYDGKPARRTSMAARCMFLALFCASYLVIVQPAVAPDAEGFEEKAGVYYHEYYDGPEIGDGTNSAFIYKGPDGKYQLFINYEFSRYLSEDEVSSDAYSQLRVFEEGD